MDARTQAVAAAVVLALAPVAFAADAVTFHMSPAGNDAWSGRTAATRHPGTGRSAGSANGSNRSTTP